MTSMPDLQITDTQDAKQGLVGEFFNRPELLPPVYVISHRRATDPQTLLKIQPLWDLATVVVSEAEYLEYSRALSGVKLLQIPEGYRGLSGGVGRARQFCLDTAELLGQEHILILDDDTLQLSVLYNVGTRASRVSRNYGLPIPQYSFGVLGLAAAVAADAYAAEPGAVLASSQGRASDRSVRAAAVRWKLNSGGPPAQMQSWRVDRFAELCGSLELDRFNYHGDDIGVAVQIAAAGGSVVKIPSIVGDYRNHETESVIRTPDTAPQLRAEEHRQLMSGPLAEYIKTRTDFLDRPMWHSVDWGRLARDGVTRRSMAYWIDPTA